MAEPSPYLMLKVAQQFYSKVPDALSVAERLRVAEVAARQQLIEHRILACEDAAAVVVPEDSLTRAAAEIRDRYPTDAEFKADLARNSLNESSLGDALYRDLRVEAVLDRIGSRAAKVTDTDIEIFYLTNLERFQRPETRKLSQILVTINEALPGSEREAAETKILAIRDRLTKSPERFAEQALKHSECPTAMNGGSLGEVKRGTLYAELEPAAFALEVHALSVMLESPLGFHLLRCDAIQAERALTLHEVRDRIRQHLEESRRKVCQKAWIGQLLRQTA
jgi:peptidyl-prolyl cis-trans isomerase C